MIIILSYLCQYKECLYKYIFIYNIQYNINI